MRGVVLRQVGDESLDVVDDLGVVPVGPGHVRVRMRATGVCHSDLSAMTGTLPAAVPCVLGHEGAGEVVEVGDGVDKLAVGDHVVVAWIPPCGDCAFCLGGEANLCSTYSGSGFSPRFTVGGEPAFGFAGAGTFAEETVLPAAGAIKVDPDVPWDVASLLGCAVMTGVGAAINTAPVTPGASVVVFGCGGIGVAVIQGARIGGAAEIVAVDPVEQRRQEALAFGATHAAHPDEVDDLKATITGGRGFDFAFEAVGVPTTIRAAYDAARRGGTACIVGAGRSDQTVELNAFELFYGNKTLVGTLYGGGDVRKDFDRLIRLWRTGRLDLDAMITQRLALADVGQALDDMKAGKVVRSVIEI
jgi:S-(hydroxymethyl)glutathione dehydrogenase/alcohol dehydrogenase